MNLIKMKDFERIKFYIEKTKNKLDFINKQNENGETALMVASKNGNFDIVKYLEENNATVHLKDHNGKTALMLATENGHFQIVEYLCECHAVLDERDNQHRTARMLAQQNGYIEIENYLYHKGLQ